MVRLIKIAIDTSRGNVLLSLIALNIVFILRYVFDEIPHARTDKRVSCHPWSALACQRFGRSRPVATTLDSI
jgi:hypothetical protein